MALIIVIFNASSPLALKLLEAYAKPLSGKGGMGVLHNDGHEKHN